MADLPHPLVVLVASAVLRTNAIVLQTLGWMQTLEPSFGGMVEVTAAGAGAGADGADGADGAVAAASCTRCLRLRTNEIAPAHVGAEVLILCQSNHRRQVERESRNFHRRG